MQPENHDLVIHCIEQRKFLPVLAMDWFGLLRKTKQLEGNFGILAPFSSCSKNFLQSIRETGKPFFLDSSVFKDKSFSWHHDYAEFIDNRWIRVKRLIDPDQLAQKINFFLGECSEFSPDYVFAPDVFGEPLLSLHLARLTWEEYTRQSRNFTLIGVVQAGEALYNWSKEHLIPQKDAFPPHYQDPRSFLASLISEYRNIGYQHIALGGLLKNEPTMPTGLKFGLSSEKLDELLTWSRPDFVLGGLALSRLEVLRKHNVWADSTNWLWWDSRYDNERFGQRNALQEVVG
jgi:hypothetical protein